MPPIVAELPTTVLIGWVGWLLPTTAVAIAQRSLARSGRESWAFLARLRADVTGWCEACTVLVPIICLAEMVALARGGLPPPLPPTVALFGWVLVPGGAALLTTHRSLARFERSLGRAISGARASRRYRIAEILLGGAGVICVIAPIAATAVLGIGWSLAVAPPLFWALLRYQLRFYRMTGTVRDLDHPRGEVIRREARTLGRGSIRLLTLDGGASDSLSAIAVPPEGAILIAPRLLEVLTEEELAAVARHELIHLAEGRLFYLRALPMLGWVVSTQVLVAGYRDLGPVVSGGLAVLGYALARVGTRRITHLLERRADRGAADMPGAYASALERIYAAELVNPDSGWAATYPSLASRVGAEDASRVDAWQSRSVLGPGWLRLAAWILLAGVPAALYLFRMFVAAA